MWNSTKTFWNVPERNVDQLRLQNKIKLVGLLLNSLDLILSQIHQAIHVSLKTSITLGTPLKPQLENVIMTSTLNNFVTSIISNIVEFILNDENIERISKSFHFLLSYRHEKILGRHLVTTKKQALERKIFMKISIHSPLKAMKQIPKVKQL